MIAISQKADFAVSERYSAAALITRACVVPLPPHPLEHDEQEALAQVGQRSIAVAGPDPLIRQGLKLGLFGPNLKLPPGSFEPLAASQRSAKGKMLRPSSLGLPVPESTVPSPG